MPAPLELQAALLAGLLARDEAAVGAAAARLPEKALSSLMQQLPASLAKPLAAGDAAAACRRLVHPRWLLLLDSLPLQHAVLQQLRERAHHGSMPGGFDLISVLVVTAAQVGDAPALCCCAAALPAVPGRLPADYQRLAEDAVAAACMHDSCASGEAGQESVLQRLVQLSTPVEAAPAGARRHAPSPLAPYLACQLDSCLEGAARAGCTAELNALLAAGVRVTPAALRAAVEGGCVDALSLLLHHGAPAPEPALLLPGDDSRPARYACPVLALLAAHAAQVCLGFGGAGSGAGTHAIPCRPLCPHSFCLLSQGARLLASRPPPQGREELHPDSLAMAERLAAAGYRPAAALRAPLAARRRHGGGGGLERAATVAPHRFSWDPAVEDAALDVAGRGRRASGASDCAEDCCAVAATCCRRRPPPPSLGSHALGSHPSCPSFNLAPSLSLNPCTTSAAGMFGSPPPRPAGPLPTTAHTRRPSAAPPPRCCWPRTARLPQMAPRTALAPTLAAAGLARLHCPARRERWGGCQVTCWRRCCSGRRGPTPHGPPHPGRRRRRGCAAGGAERQRTRQ